MTVTVTLSVSRRRSLGGHPHRGRGRDCRRPLDGEGRLNHEGLHVEVDRCSLTLEGRQWAMGAARGAQGAARGEGVAVEMRA